MRPAPLTAASLHPGWGHHEARVCTHACARHSPAVDTLTSHNKTLIIIGRATTKLPQHFSHQRKTQTFNHALLMNSSRVLKIGSPLLSLERSGHLELLMSSQSTALRPSPTPSTACLLGCDYVAVVDHAYLNRFHTETDTWQHAEGKTEATSTRAVFPTESNGCLQHTNLRTCFFALFVTYRTGN